MAEPTAQHDPVRTRRAVLAAAAGGAAALAVGAIHPRAAAAASVAVMTEVDNPTTAPTGITNSTADEGAFLAHAAGAGTAIEADSTTGLGVMSTSSDTSDPATNVRNAGVVGVAGDNTQIAANVSLTGVYGYSDPSNVDGFVGAGVWGDSADFGVIGTGGIGVDGEGGWGVLGFTSASDGIGVVASAELASARALRVEGRAEFTRSGRTTMSSGTSTKKITLAGCTSATLVFAMLASNRSGRYIRAVVPTTGSFTIYLNTSLTSAAYVVWIAFTNPSGHAG